MIWSRFAAEGGGAAAGGSKVTLQAATQFTREKKLPSRYPTHQPTALTNATSRFGNRKRGGRRTGRAEPRGTDTSVPAAGALSPSTCPSAGASGGAGPRRHGGGPRSTRTRMHRAAALLFLSGSLSLSCKGGVYAYVFSVTPLKKKCSIHARNTGTVVMVIVHCTRVEKRVMAQVIQILPCLFIEMKLK